MTGRPRSAEADRAILAAAVHLLARDGYQSMRMADVAAEAGVGKPTLYRRYPNKPELVAAAILALTASPQADHDPDLPVVTSAALLFLLRSAAAALATPGGMIILGSLLAQEQRDPDLIAAFRTRVFEPRHAVVRAVLSRGIAAGDVDPTTPLDVVVDVLFGSLLARAVLGEAVTDEWLADVVGLALRGSAPAASAVPTAGVPPDASAPVFRS